MLRPAACAAASGLLITAALLLISGCATPPPADPVAALAKPSLLNKEYHAAMQELAQRPANDEDANKALEKVIAGGIYTPPVREEALDLLAHRDLPRAKRTLRNTLPNTTAWAWLQRASAIIAERNWVDLTPALVSSWARPSILQTDDMQRPEYVSLAKLHGKDKVIDVVFDTFQSARETSQQGLRTRCWDLLYRLGQKDRLVALLNSADIPKDDTLLLDLQAAAHDLGVVAHNREEILWLRKLRLPEHAEFWSRATAAAQDLSPARRAELEIRDLPVMVSASLHDPSLLTASKDDLYRRVEAHVKAQNHHSQESNFEGFTGGKFERLGEFRELLTWGDLAAMLIAIRAMQVPQVVEHLFDYAERDRADKSTEYGGVIALDDKDRFEIKEFPPVVREQDQKFLASQQMLDTAYTAIFHFHFHVQYIRNERFAGPGFGDVNYADGTRANCLVFTSINENTMNVDFYRHDHVVVDLGEITRK